MLKIITLELARNPGYPEGDSGHRYIVRAPLDSEGYLDRFAWAALKGLCVVRHIDAGLEIEIGLLILNRRGEWVFSYAPGDEDDETLFKLGKHRFAPGEYVSITEHDGIQRTFRVASVADWRPVRTVQAEAVHA